MTGGTAAEYSRLAFDLGNWLADAAIAVIAEAGVAKREIARSDRTARRSGTSRRIRPGSLARSAVIAERTGIDVVATFACADVAAGGQGAPLVPIADALLFGADKHWRALQNIGGIGNVTVVPPGGKIEGVRAFDTGPGVAVIDGVVRALEPKLPYDVDGKLAGAGTPIDAVVDDLLAAPYFSAPPPKSTGRELFDAAYIKLLIESLPRDSARRDDGGHRRHGDGAHRAQHRRRLPAVPAGADRGSAAVGRRREESGAGRR